jgi:hypothetical protein
MFIQLLFCLKVKYLQNFSARVVSRYAWMDVTYFISENYFNSFNIYTRGVERGIIGGLASSRWSGRDPVGGLLVTKI